MRSQIEEKIAEEAALQPATDEVLTFAINPAVTVDPEAFQTQLLRLAAQFKADNRIQLASILENGHSSFQHNQWTFSVENDLMRSFLEREQEILPFLRQQLRIPDLFWEIQVDAQYVNPQDKIPYTNEEKLKEMARKNPNLGQLQEIFKTRIIY